MKITITGVKELDSKLSTFTPRVQKSIERKAVRKAAKPVLETARQKVPVKTGALKKSIKIRALPRYEQQPNQVGVRVMTDLYYAKWVEYGRANRKQPSKPYMRPAADLNKGAVKSVFTAEIKPIIEQEARKKG